MPDRVRIRVDAGRVFRHISILPEGASGPAGASRLPSYRPAPIQHDKPKNLYSVWSAPSKSIPKLALRSWLACFVIRLRRRLTMPLLSLTISRSVPCVVHLLASKWIKGKSSNIARQYSWQNTWTRQEKYHLRVRIKISNGKKSCFSKIIIIILKLSMILPSLAGREGGTRRTG